MKKVEKEFELVNRIIERHWSRAIGLANAESLMTYWTVGAFVSERLKNAQWGSKTIEALSDLTPCLSMPSCMVTRKRPSASAKSCAS